MDLEDVIEETINKIKTIENIQINSMYLEEQKEIMKGQHDFNSSLEKLYSKYKKIKISWECKDNNDNGYFELLSNKEVFSKQEELVELTKEFIGDGTIEDIDIIAEDIRNWLPIFRFPNDDMFCIDKRNDKIVFFEHEVFDTGINLHGLVIAKDIEDLMEKWSKVLFIDIYDWYDGVDENGIDLSKDVYKNIITINNI